jgi:hypothetical protein
MKAMAIVGVVISVVFIVGMLGIMFSNEPMEVNAGMVLAGSFYWLAFSIVALVSLSKLKKEKKD